MSGARDITPAMQDMYSAAQRLRDVADHPDFEHAYPGMAGPLADWLVMEADRGYPLSVAVRVARAILGGAS